MLKKFVEEKTKEIIDALFKLQDSIKNDGLRIDEEKVVVKINNDYSLARDAKRYYIYYKGFAIYAIRADQSNEDIIGQIVGGYLSLQEM